MIIISYLENIERAIFLTSLVEKWSEHETIEAKFITSKYSVYRYCNERKINCLFINVVSEDENEELEVEGDKGLITSSSTFMMENITLKEAYKLIKAFEKGLQTLAGVCSDLLLLFNGEGLGDKVVKRYFGNDVPTLYFEIGNFPSKVFANKLGVNAKSSLYLHKESVGWLKEFDYEEIKRKKMVAPPQARKKIMAKFFEWYWDLYGVFFKKAVYQKSFNLIHKMNKLYEMKQARRLIQSKNDINSLEELGQYTFVPLQVSTDTQLLINSDVRNNELIQISCRDAAMRNESVIIKFHPAETNANDVQKIIENYSGKEKVYFTSSIPTPQLIDKANKVYSINSNVGLEAILQGKEVTFFGRTFLDSFTKENAHSFIKNYLLDIGYPYVSSLSEKTVAKLYCRIGDGT